MLMNKCASVRKLYPETLNFSYACTQESVYIVLCITSPTRSNLLFRAIEKHEKKKKKNINIRYKLDNVYPNSDCVYYHNNANNIIVVYEEKKKKRIQISALN